MFLKSVDHDYYYKGHCRDLQQRLIQHNSGMTVSIRPFIPFEIVYAFEAEAIKKERYFESAAGRSFLKATLNRMRIPARLRHAGRDSRPGYLLYLAIFTCAFGTKSSMPLFK